MTYKPIYVEGNKEAKAKLFGGECDVFTTDCLASAGPGEDPSKLWRKYQEAKVHLLDKVTKWEDVVRWTQGKY